MIEINFDKLFKAVDIDLHSLAQSMYTLGDHDYCAIDEQLYAQMLGWCDNGPRKRQYKQVHRYDCNCKCRA